MNILLFGKNGQIGWELQRSLAPLGILTAPSSGDGKPCGDFTDPDGIAKTVRAIAPDVIVNAAAYTAVDKAESDVERATMVNATTPAVLAAEAKRLDALLVHYSTDYVFDGSGERPWQETDPTGPLNVYGATKLAGEQTILTSGCRHLIFRTSWVYAARGANFAKTMLRLAQEREQLNVIDDQTGAPTGAELLADATAHAITSAQRDRRTTGLYHLAAGGQTTWHGYAAFVIEFARQAGLDIKVATENIRAVPTSQFPTPAKRPANSRLDTAKLQNGFGLTLPHWQTGITRMLTEIIEKTL